MVLERADSIYDLQALQSEQEKFLGLLKESKDAIIDLNNTRVTAKSSSLSDFKKETEALNEAINKSTTSTKTAKEASVQLSAAQIKLLSINKEIDASVKAGIIAQSKRNVLSTEYGKALTEERLALQRANAEAKTQTQINTSVTGSLDNINARLKKLRDQKGKIAPITPEDVALLDQYKKRIDNLEGIRSGLLDKRQAQANNVGNYPTVSGNFGAAFSTLSKELEKLRTQISTIGKDSPGLQKLENEEKLLTQLTENLGKAFKSPTQELKAFTNAAKEIGQQFGSASEVFNSFVKEVGEKKDELQDIQNTINFQASDTKYLDGIVSAVSGLAGAYGVAEASATLFGDGTEDLQKQMVKLQAVMTLVTSLQSILNAVQNDGAAVQTALAAKTALLNAARKIQALVTVETAAATEAVVIANIEEAVSSGITTAAIAEQVAVTEAGSIANAELAATAGAGAIALEGEAAAAGVATTATEGFSTALIATGIGAVIIAIAAGVVYLTSQIGEWKDATGLNIEEQKKLNDAVKEQYSTLQRISEIIIKNASFETDELNRQAEAAAAAGENQYKLFAAKKKIADLNKEIAGHGFGEAIAQAEQDVVDTGLKGADALAKAYARNNAIISDTSRRLVLATKDLAKLNATNVNGVNDREIKSVEKLVDIYKTRIEAAQSAVDFYKGSEQKIVAANAASNLLQVEQDKFAADERRKIILESAKIEADLAISKNAIILSDERSTQSERLTAIKSTAAQQRAIIAAELAAVQSDPSKKGTSEETIAIKKAAADNEKITNDTTKQIFEINESYRKRELKAALDYLNTKISLDKNAQERIFNNEEDTLNDRYNAVVKFYDDQQDTIDAAYNETIKTTILTYEERSALDGKYNADSVENSIARSEKLVSIEEDTTKRLVAELQKRKDAADTEKTNNAQNSTNVQVTGLIEEYQLKLAGKTGKKRIALQEELQQRITEIDKLGALERLKIEEDAASADIGAAMLIETPTEELEAKRTEIRRKEAELRKGISDDEYKNEEDNLKKKLQATIDTFEGIKQVGEAAFSVADGLINASTITQKNALKEQQDEAEKKAARDIEIVNASTLSEEEKAARIAIINARLQAQKDEFDRRNRQIELQKARADKAKAIFEITVNTAIAVAKALPNVFEAIAVGVLGAAQLAIAIATPLPKYRHGRGMGKEEMAITGDGGVSEYIVRGDGSIEKTPSVETLTHLMPKDRVLPNKAALMRELAMGILPSATATANGIDKTDIKKLGDRIDEAVSGIHITTQLVTKAGWRNHNQKLADYNRWVAATIKN